MSDSDGDEIERREAPEYDGHRERKQIARRWVDHHMGFVRWAQDRPFGKTDQFPQNYPYQFTNLYPPVAYDYVSVNLPCRLVIAKMNKIQARVNAMAWQVDGKRLVAGYDNGVVTLWNGLNFQFDIRMPSGKTAWPPVTELLWTHRGDYMVTLHCDKVRGANLLKLWQSNYDVLDEFTVHQYPNYGEAEIVNQLTFSPCDRKFATCCDDRTISIWDLSNRVKERTIQAHDKKVKTVDWHPSRSLLASGSEDNKVKLFDPRDRESDGLNTFEHHKGSISKVLWHPDGRTLLSSGDDGVRQLDIRTMKELMLYRSHEHKVCSIAWHPTQEDMFASGGWGGELDWWCTGVERPLWSLKPHKNAILQIRFHPLGHIMATTGKEGAVKFWTRYPIGENVLQSPMYKASLQQQVDDSVVQGRISGNIPGLPRRSAVVGTEADGEMTGDGNEDNDN